MASCIPKERRSKPLTAIAVRERPLVFEVTIRRVRGHTDLTRHLTETEGFGADLLDEPHASINQRVPKVAMVVGRFRGSHVIMLTP